MGLKDPHPEETGSEEEMGETEEYIFRFKTPAQVTAENEAGHHWMRVSDILGLAEMSKLLPYGAARGIGNDERATSY